MKKFLFFVLLFLGMALFPYASSAEVIDNFQANIKINPDSSIDVVETISYNFQGMYRHGIFRTIPIKYQARGGNYNLRISDIQAVDAVGNPYSFQTSYQGNNIEIKIGDPNQTITGKKEYVVKYTILRAINYFDTQDEFYWNITGNEWPVAIKEASAEISLPKSINDKHINAQCYSGIFGSTDTTKCSAEVTSDKTTVSIRSNVVLQSDQGLTAVIGFPKKIVAQPTKLQLFLLTLEDNWVLALPIFTLFTLCYLWWTRGRDPKGRGTIIAQFDAPDNLTPLEVGTLVDIDADNKDVSAEIVNLAVKGYLKITRIKDKGILFDSTDYLLEKLKKEDDLKNNFEKKLMRSLFAGDLNEIMKINTIDEAGKMIIRNSLTMKSTKLSDLKNVFYKNLAGIKEDAYSSLIAKGYFRENPKTIKVLYGSIGGGVVLFSLFILSSVISGIAVISLVISGILIAIFGLIMPARTKKGVNGKEYVLGLKEYLSVAEKDRINFHNAPEKNFSQFEKLLPFAMVLGVEKEWAKQFEGVYAQNPNWYNDPSGANFNSTLFVHNINSFSLAANSNLSSVPGGASSGSSGFGGGGFSGGGFGGGGGGSW